MKMAEAMAKKQSTDTDMELQELKNQKDSIMQVFNLKIAELELQKNEQRAEENQIKYTQKQNKIKSDLLKEYFASNGGGGNIAIGDDMIGQMAQTEVAPDAQGLPMLDNIS